MIVDAHAHPYSPDEISYPPMPDAYRAAARRRERRTPQAEMEASGVDRAVLIQTNSFYGTDNHFIRDLSATSSDWAVGVCNLDPDDPHSPDVLYSFVERSNIRGCAAYGTCMSGPILRAFGDFGARRTG